MPSVVPDVYRKKNGGLTELPAPRKFVTEHTARIGGQQLRYTATAGETYITNLFGEPIASIFSFSYVKSDGRDPVAASRSSERSRSSSNGSA